MIIQHICPNCFCGGTMEGDKCRACGYQDRKDRDSSALPAGFFLHQRYCIGKVLGAGGFGITYLACDMETRQKYAVKEYFPRQWGVRDVSDHTRVLPGSRGANQVETLYQHGLDVFENEAKILAVMAQDPVIVKVCSFIRENNTAYLVMERIRGITLSAYMNRTHTQFAWRQTDIILENIAKPLGELHELGLLHRDISPDNIMLQEDGRVKLIDFGATRQYVMNESSDLSVLVKPGFAPLEQYSRSGKQGPWTDVYALAATYYYMVSGKTVISAPDRCSGEVLQPLDQLVPEVPAKIARVIDHALALEYTERIRDMRQFVQEISRAEGRGLGLPHLILASGDQKRCWECPADRDIYIGRSPETCSICVQGSSISRFHCSVRYDSQKRQFLITDQSANGTYTRYGLIGKGQSAALPPGEIIYLVSMQYKIILEVR